MEQEQQIQKSPMQLERRRSELPSPMQANKEKGLSVFAGLPAASDMYLQQWAATLAAAFPKIEPEFWAVCVKLIRRDGLSEQRLRYIAEKLCREWRYPTMQIADILDVDKKFKVWSYREFYKEFRTTEVEGYCIIEERASDGTIQFCATVDAERAGIKIMRKF